MNFRTFLFQQTAKNNFVRHFRYINCWSCGNDASNLVKDLFCSSCNALQRPSHENYFKLIGVSETFDLNEIDLARKYKELQRHLHPDKYSNRGNQEQEISAQYSSLVNDAYKTLLDPLARGIYMMRLRGKEIPEKTEVDQEFLLKIMEKNEEVEEADSEEEIMKLNKENKSQIKDLQKKVSAAFFHGDLKKVIRLLAIMKYYTSIDSQIQEVIRRKGIIR